MQLINRRISYNFPRSLELPDIEIRRDRSHSQYGSTTIGIRQHEDRQWRDRSVLPTHNR